MAKIVWLASYPKSGNTWVRAFFANYQSESQEPVGLSLLSKYQIASSRDLFDCLSGFEASNFTEQEIGHYRPQVFKYLPPTQDTSIFKVHDAFWQKNHKPIIPIMESQSIIYIIRNPLDVAISFSYHRGKSIDDAINRMNANSSFGKSLNNQFIQYLGTWSEHVTSWIDQELLPVQIIRYEDMLQNPFQAFQDILAWSGLEYHPDRFEKALRFSSFTRLQQQEDEQGFSERPAEASAPFFREGKAGQWRAQLSAEQRTRIITTHGVVMERFCYLPLPNDMTA